MVFLYHRTGTLNSQRELVLKCESCGQEVPEVTIKGWKCYPQLKDGDVVLVFPLYGEGNERDLWSVVKSLRRE